VQPQDKGGVMTLKEELATKGFAKTGDVGGQPKQRYWTPDGREIMAMPEMHEFTRKKDGKVVEIGIRDANLDNGWLISRPNEPKLYCPNCDKWHDTKLEIKDCGIKRNKFLSRVTKKAEKELGKNDRIEQLESELKEIKNLLKKMVK
jgi:hypothetical protein